METPFEVVVEFWNLVRDAYLHVCLHFYTEQQIVAFTSASIEQAGTLLGPLPNGLYRSVCTVPGNVLNQGSHRIMLLIVQDKARSSIEWKMPFHLSARYGSADRDMVWPRTGCRAD
jgi:hypothetical protein